MNKKAIYITNVNTNLWLTVTSEKINPGESDSVWAESDKKYANNLDLFNQFALWDMLYDDSGRCWFRHRYTGAYLWIWNSNMAAARQLGVGESVDSVALRLASGFGDASAQMIQLQEGADYTLTVTPRGFRMGQWILHSEQSADCNFKFLGVNE
ncbi:TPA: hypothetical protein ACQVH3_005045 [Serratia marcescens]